jgi:hypothetical protein
MTTLKRMSVKVYHPALSNHVTERSPHDMPVQEQTGVQLQPNRKPALVKGGR